MACLNGPIQSVGAFGLAVAYLDPASARGSVKLDLLGRPIRMTRLNEADASLGQATGQETVVSEG
jgi:hypothetical protein